MFADHAAYCLEHCQWVDEEIITVVTGMYGYSVDVLSEILNYSVGYSDFEQLDQKSLHSSEDCPVYQSLIEDGTVKSYHTRCDTEITFDAVTRDYFAVCPKCDEDLYKFETYQD